MASAEANLIEELIHNASVSGQRPLERRLADLSVWFYQNLGRIPRDNLAARQAFMEKAFWCFIEITAFQVERLHEIESLRAGRNLWIPKGLKMEGDVTKFG